MSAAVHEELAEQPEDLTLMASSGREKRAVPYLYVKTLGEAEAMGTLGAIHKWS